MILFVALIFIAIPSFKFDGATISAPDAQNAYSDFLQGEKEIYTGSVDWSGVLLSWSLGEKTVVYGFEDAMTTYRQGEKDL
jgi:hypothetical protein